MSLGIIWKATVAAMPMACGGVGPPTPATVFDGAAGAAAATALLAPGLPGGGGETACMPVELARRGGGEAAGGRPLDEPLVDEPLGVTGARGGVDDGLDAGPAVTTEGDESEWSGGATGGLGGAVGGPGRVTAGLPCGVTGTGGGPDSLREAPGLTTTPGNAVGVAGVVDVDAAPTRVFPVPARGTGGATGATSGGGMLSQPLSISIESEYEGSAGLPLVSSLSATESDATPVAG